MGKHILTKHIRKIYIMKLIPAILFLGICLYIWLTYPFMDILKPTALQNSSDVFRSLGSNNNYLEITASDLYYTGYDCISNNEVKGSYYYTFIDDKCVFFLLSANTHNQNKDYIDNLTVKAKISTDKSSLNYIIENFASDINWTTKGLSAASANFIISQLDYYVLNTYMLIAVLSPISIYTLISTFIYVFLLIYPHRSLVCKHLKLSGSTKYQLMRADYEFKNRRYFYAGDMSITASYFIEISKYKIEIVPLKNILWVYKHSTYKRSPASSPNITYTLSLHCITKAVNCYKKEKIQADKVLEYLENNCPHILIGYTPENKREIQMQKNKKLPQIQTASK